MWSDFPLKIFCFLTPIFSIYLILSYIQVCYCNVEWLWVPFTDNKPLVPPIQCSLHPPLLTHFFRFHVLHPGLVFQSELAEPIAGDLSLQCRRHHVGPISDQVSGGWGGIRWCPPTPNPHGPPPCCDFGDHHPLWWQCPRKSALYSCQKQPAIRWRHEPHSSTRHHQCRVSMVSCRNEKGFSFGKWTSGNICYWFCREEHSFLFTFTIINFILRVRKSVTVLCLVL